MDEPTELESAEHRAMCLASVLTATRAFYSETGLPSPDEMVAIIDGLGINAEHSPHETRIIGMLIGVGASLAIRLNGEPHLVGLLDEANKRVELARGELDDR